MKTKLTSTEKAVLLPNIERVLKTGKPWEDKLLHCPVEAIVNAILSIPGVQRKPLEDPQYGIDGFETNGWQWDWWQHFSHGGKNYTLSGSGYYGGHAFNLSDE
jgi:hypothetical protein